MIPVGAQIKEEVNTRSSTLKITDHAFFTPRHCLRLWTSGPGSPLSVTSYREHYLLQLVLWQRYKGIRFPLYPCYTAGVCVYHGCNRVHHPTVIRYRRVDDIRTILRNSTLCRCMPDVRWMSALVSAPRTVCPFFPGSATATGT